MPKSAEAFRTISEVAEWLETPAHVLRFWESKFTQIKPVKRAGGRRYYRPADMELLGGIKRLLHEDGMTIKGVQKILREQGIRHVAALSPNLGEELRTVLDDDPVDEHIDVEAHAEPQSGEVLHFKPTKPATEPPQDKVIPQEPVADAPAPNNLPDHAKARSERIAAEAEDTALPSVEERAENDAPDALHHASTTHTEADPATPPHSAPVAPEEPVAIESSPPEPETPPVPPAPKSRPRVIETPPDPSESDVDVPPGFLTRLMERDAPFDATEKTALAPLLQRLATLRDGMAAPHKH